MPYRSGGGGDPFQRNDSVLDPSHATATDLRSLEVDSSPSYLAVRRCYSATGPACSESHEVK